MPVNPRLRDRLMSCWIALFVASGGCSSDDSNPAGSAGSSATVRTPVNGNVSNPSVAGQASISNPTTTSSGLAGSTATPPAANPSAAAGGGAVPPPPNPGAAGMRGAMPMPMPGRGMTPPPPPAAAGSSAPAGPPADVGPSCLKGGDPNYAAAGPYKVAQKEVDLGMIDPNQHTGKFTIYYPDPFEANCPHPIVAWGNGTGVQGSGVYTFLNSHAASWGIVVAEAQEDNTGSGKFHKAGLDYLLKENGDPMSMFYKKLSTKAGVSGHSQGGFGASAGSSHPNVVTSVVEGAGGAATAKVSLLVLTGTMDIVSNPEGLVAAAQGPMFVANWEGGDHVTTETIAGFIAGDKGSLQFQRLYAAWFRCFLADDSAACKLFKGGTPDNCGICKDPGWHSLTSKNL